MASLSTLTVSTFYMIAQMVGAGTLVALLLNRASASTRRSSASGMLMIVYVVFGGMLATTWVQIIKAILLMSGTILLSILVLAHFDFSFGDVLRRDRPRDVHGERPDGRPRLPAARPALQAAVRRAGPHLARAWR